MYYKRDTKSNQLKARQGRKNPKPKEKLNGTERYNYNISNNLVLLRFHCCSCTDTQVPHLGFYWHLPTSVYFMEGNLTHQNQKESLTTPWDFHQFRIEAQGQNFRATAKQSAGCPCSYAGAVPSPRRAQCKAKSCRAPPAHSAGNASSWTHRRTKHSLQEKQECLLGGWKMSTVLPVNVGVSCTEFSGVDH